MQKKMWGDDVWVKKNKDGSRFYMYKHRHLNILTTASVTVVSIGIFSEP